MISLEGNLLIGLNVGSNVIIITFVSLAFR